MEPDIGKSFIAEGNAKYYMKRVISKGEYTPASVRGGTVLDAAVANSGWKTGYLQQVKELAGADFAAGVRMGQVYRGMEQAALSAYISPDRAEAFARTEASMQGAMEQSARNGYSLELPGGLRAEISMADFLGADVYNQSGECIASYSTLCGWTEHQTIAELEFLRESKNAYLSAWNTAMSASCPKAPKKPHMDVTA